MRAILGVAMAGAASLAIAQESQNSQYGHDRGYDDGGSAGLHVVDADWGLFLAVVQLDRLHDSHLAQGGALQPRLCGERLPQCG